MKHTPFIKESALEVMFKNPLIENAIPTPILMETTFEIMQPYKDIDGKEAYSTATVFLKGLTSLEEHKKHKDITINYIIEHNSGDITEYKSKLNAVILYLWVFRIYPPKEIIISKFNYNDHSSQDDSYDEEPKENILDDESRVMRDLEDGNGDLHGF